MASRGHRQVPHGGLAAPTEHPYWTGLGQHRKVLGMETKRALHWTRGGDEASTTPIRLQGCSTTQGNLPRLLLGRTRLQHQASLKSVSVRLQVARSAAFFNIKLWRCCDPDSLSPKVGHHLHLASSAVPRYRPQQAVATCYPNLVRRPRPLWCKISVLPHVAHGSATQSW